MRFPNRLVQRMAVVLVCLPLGACALWPALDLPSTATESRDLVERMAAADLVLIGELHDNVAMHRQRLVWLDLLADRVPITVAMEPFDADAQSALEAARAETRPGESLADRARRIAQAAGFRFDGWDWSLYGPVVELALRRNWPLVGANLSSAQTFAIARGQSHPLADRVPSAWGPQVEKAQSDAIEQGHCGLMPPSMLPPMVRAQRARDAQMAEVLITARQGGRTVVLLAGNGHVRRDLGVPLHLADRAGAWRVLSVGLLEPGDAQAAPYDVTRVFAAQPREDPCQALRERFGKPRSP